MGIERSLQGNGRLGGVTSFDMGAGDQVSMDVDRHGIPTVLFSIVKPERDMGVTLLRLLTPLTIMSDPWGCLLLFSFVTYLLMIILLFQSPLSYCWDST
jgi:hypothetical protein